MSEKEKKVNWFKKLLLLIFHSIWTITIVLYIFSILGSLLPSWAGAIFAPFTTLYPIFFLALIVIFLDILRRKNKRFIIIVSLLLFISIPMIWRYCPLNFKKEITTQEANNISILSYNVNVFRMDSRWSAQPSGIMEYILKKDADIVCLQEATLQSRSSYGLTLKEIKSRVGKRYPYVRHDFAQGKYGSSLMILSKYPIVGYENIYLKSFVNGAVSYTVDIDGEKVLIVNAHLESFKLRLPFQSRQKSINNIKESIKKTHKAISGKRGIIHSYYLRNNQVSQIANFVKKNAPNGKAIVCGDFNAIPTSYPVSRIGWQLDNCYSSAGTGLGISFRSNIFVVRIDNMFCSKDFTPLYCEILEDIKLSDHYPIYTIMKKNWVKDKEK